MNQNNLNKLSTLGVVALVSALVSTSGIFSADANNCSSYGYGYGNGTSICKDANGVGENIDFVADDPRVTVNGRSNTSPFSSETNSEKSESTNEKQEIETSTNVDTEASTITSNTSSNIDSTDNNYTENTIENEIDVQAESTSDMILFPTVLPQTGASK